MGTAPSFKRMHLSVALAQVVDKRTVITAVDKRLMERVKVVGKKTEKVADTRTKDQAVGRETELQVANKKAVRIRHHHRPVLPTPRGIKGRSEQDEEELRVKSSRQRERQLSEVVSDRHTIQ